MATKKTLKKGKLKIKRPLVLRLPDDPVLLQAAGRCALAHAHVEHVTRRAIGKLAEISLRQALIVTQRTGAAELRETVRRLVKEKAESLSQKDKKEVLEKTKALLKAASDLSEKRNALIHRPWAKRLGGDYHVKDGNHNWGPSPSAADLNNLADQLIELASEFKEETQDGFINQLVES